MPSWASSTSWRRHSSRNAGAALSSASINSGLARPPTRREHEPIVELCRERAIAFVPFFPLGSGFTGGPKTLAKDPAIAQVAEKHGATPSQVALVWLLARYERMLLIPGTTSVEHLEENLAAGEVELEEEDMKALEGVVEVGNPLG